MKRINPIQLPTLGVFVVFAFFLPKLCGQVVFNATLTSLNSNEAHELLTKVTQYQTFQFDADSLYKIAQAQGQRVNFQLNIDQYGWDFALKHYEIYSPGATISYIDQYGIHTEAAGPSSTYKGTLASDPTAVVRLRISKTTFGGFIRTSSDTYRIDPIGKWLANPNVADMFVIIKESDILQPPSATEPWCPTTGEETGGNEIVEREGGRFHIEVALDCNYEMYLRYLPPGATTGIGKIIAENIAEDYILEVDERYEAELDINVSLSYCNVWATPGPFEGHFSDSETLWTTFKNYWNAHNACINRDIAILLKGESAGTGAAGYMKPDGVGAVCVGRAVSYAFVIESNYTPRTIGHEMGHWLSTGHTLEDTCATTCYVMCQAPDCAYGAVTDGDWKFSPQSISKINSYLKTNDLHFVNYRHDWCLGSSLGITGPDRLCHNQVGTYSYNAFLAGTGFPGGPTHALQWSTGSDLTIISADPDSQTVTVKATGNNNGSTWVGVQLVLTQAGINYGYGCTSGSPLVRKAVHTGLPLSAGTPSIQSYWVPGYPNGSYHYDIGFGTSESATEYQYTYQLYNVQYPGTYSGTTTDLSPLITDVPQGGCFTATILAGNECGFLTPSQTTNFPLTICFNNPIKSPDGSEMVQAELAGKAIELPISKPKDDLANPPVFTAFQSERLFPNPANSEITLYLPHEHSIVSVNDTAGRAIARFEFGSGLHKISSKDWLEGIFFFSIRTDEEINVHKILINHK